MGLSFAVRDAVGNQPTFDAVVTFATYAKTSDDGWQRTPNGQHWTSLSCIDQVLAIRHVVRALGDQVIALGQVLRPIVNQLVATGDVMVTLVDQRGALGDGVVAGLHMALAVGDVMGALLDQEIGRAHV